MHRRLVPKQDLPIRNRKELHETFMIAAGGNLPIARGRKFQPVGEILVLVAGALPIPGKAAYRWLRCAGVEEPLLRNRPFQSQALAAF